MSPLTVRVKEVREALGWSQRELAERSGVRQATISALERGEAGINLATLEKLADALGMRASNLIVHEPKRR